LTSKDFASSYETVLFFCLIGKMQQSGFNPSLFVTGQ
jgi:hypothetical protein